MVRRVRHVHSSEQMAEQAGRIARDATMRAAGAAFAALGVFLALSLLTYSVSDPSWATATARPAQNLFGQRGASAANLLLQLVGPASVALLGPMTFWGAWLAWRGLPERTPLAGWLRLAAGPAGVMLLAGFCSALPTPAAWPFMTGLGGLLGDAVGGALSGLAAALNAPSPRTLAGALAFVLGAPLTVFAMGVRRQNLAAGRAAAARLQAKLAALTRRAVDWAADQAPEPRAALAGADPVDDEEAADFVVERPGAAPRGAADEDAPPRTPPQILRKPKEPRKSGRAAKDAQPRFSFDADGPYQLPPLNLLAKPKAHPRLDVSDEALEQNARMLEGVLADFGVRGEIIHVRPGPVVTLYELEPAAGVKSSRVIGLADDIARSMSAVAARVAVVPGRNVIGIELPNVDRETVFLRESLSAVEYEDASAGLALALGKSIGGDPVVADLARMPHLLIAGTTGSGKSVAINTMILSLLYRLPPEECKLILIDPKMLELSVYEGIPHLLAPVVTDPKKAVVALKWTVREMEERYRNMSKLGVRNIAGFNEKVAEAQQSGETPTRTVHTGYDADTGEPVYETEELEFEPMPFIVVVIDEMADLMMVAGKDIEGAVQRLAQMARAAGIHLIMATQRPSVDVITGTIKANFPTRISFQVTSKIDSRTILGEQGGEQLLGQGDMLYMAGGGRLQRVHGPFVSDQEVEKVVKHLKKQGRPDYVQDVTEMEFDGESEVSEELLGGNTSSGDSLYDQAVAIVARDRKASTSYIQRRLQIGYNRAATLIERMEDEGVIGRANHAGKREIFLPEPVD